MKYSIFFIAAAAVALYGCSKGEEAAHEAAPQLPAVGVDVVHAADVHQIKNYTATVEAENLNNIAPVSPNRIKTIAVEVGDPVRAGQVLVTLDNSAADQLRINLEQTEREYNRACRLLEIGSGTQQAVDQLASQLAGLRSQYANMVENTELRSPISGVVTARNFDPGDFSGGQAILTVGQLSPKVKILLSVSENDFASIHNGMGVEVNLDAFPGDTFRGTVERIHPTIDPATRTFVVEVAVPNADARLRPGMFARVNIDLGSRPNVVVPDRAVVKQTGSGNKYVYVLHDGTVSYNRVELGRRLDDAYEIISGVADGDTVVISGQNRLADGVAVEVLNH